MRKHKSVVAILLAVMMIFTFMPTMAFAYETGSNPVIDWGDNFQTATSKNATTGVVTNYDVTYAVTQGTGMITATASSTVNGVKTDVGSAAFFDLTGATLYRNATNPVSGNYDYSTYTNLFNRNLYVKLAKPSYIKEADWTTATVGVQDVLGTEANNWTTTYYTFAANGTADKTATKGETKNIDVKITSHQCDAEGTAAKPFLIGPDLAASVTITDGSDVAATSGWYRDSVVASNLILADTATTRTVQAFVYDGKEHTILFKAPANEVVSYEKLNSRNVWEATGAITLKDAGTYGRYRAAYKDASGVTHYSNFDNLKQQFTVASANLAPTFGFKKIADYEKYDYDVTAEQAADPAKFVELTAKSFVAVDEETLMNYFNDYYEVKVTKVASNENLQTWTIAPKYDFNAAATSDDGKALAELNKKYATLLKNYGLVTGSDENPTYGHFNASGTANVKVDTSAELNTKTDDITFSGVTTKSFKAKKKTKKLAKAKTFQVVAKADSGNVITFSATSSNGKVSIDETGVVTVKKGLKKGAKVKLVVKAKTAAGNGYKAASAEKTYTIKIK